MEVRRLSGSFDYMISGIISQLIFNPANLVNPLQSWSKRIEIKF